MTASDNVGVKDGAILIDGVIVASFSGTSATYNWNTSKVPVGRHTLQSKVQDAAGNVGTSAPVSVTIGGPDVTSPNVTITYPASGTTVRRGSTVNIAAKASDNLRVTVVKTYVNGSFVCQVSTAPFVCPWKVSSVKQAQIQVAAFDAAGNKRVAQVKVFPR